MKNNSPKSDTIHRSHTFISSVGSDYRVWNTNRRIGR